MKLSRILAVAAILAASAISAEAAVTCSVEQTGKVNSTAWVVNPPQNFSDMVRNKLRLNAYAALADGKVTVAELPSATLTCFGSAKDPNDADPHLIQNIKVVARDKKTGKECAVVKNVLSKDGAVVSSACDAEFDTVISLP
jgi:hypothetical protein